MPGETGLRVTRAVIRDGDDRVQFERLAPLQGRFVGFRVGKDQLATPINGIDGNTVTFTDRDIAPYLETTLKPLPEIDHTEPWHIQLPKIAELTANPAVRAWHQADRRQIALEPSLFLTIDRHIVHIPSGRDTLGETAPLDSAGVSIVVKASRERRDENGERRQVNMTFVGNDYHVAEPRFEGRILALDPMSPTDYTGVAKFAPDPSPEARLELITSLTKVIRGDLGPTVR